MSQESRFQVNLAGMIDILSNHLYSDQNVYIRELLQNGTDAIRARRLWDADFDAGEIQVELLQDKASGSKTLVFADNGIGLTAEEVSSFGPPSPALPKARKILVPSASKALLAVLASACCRVLW